MKRVVRSFIVEERSARALAAARPPLGSVRHTRRVQRGPTTEARNTYHFQ